MPTHNINLTPEQSQSINDRIRAGRYANVSEVMRAALRALDQDEAEDLAKVEALRHAIAEGMEGPYLPAFDVIQNFREQLVERESKKHQKELAG